MCFVATCASGSATGLFTYADVLVVGGKPAFLDNERDTLLNPNVIAETVSPETEAYDRGRTFEHYRTLESLKAYLLLASDRIHADLYTRRPSGQWLLTWADCPEDTIELESIGCRLTLADVYLKSELLPA